MSVLHFMCYCSLSNSFSESCFCVLFSSSKNAVPDSPLLSTFICTLSCSAFVSVTRVHNDHESGFSQILSLTLLPFLLKKPKNLWLSLSLTDKGMSWTFVTHLKAILFIPASHETILTHTEMHFNFCCVGTGGRIIMHYFDARQLQITFFQGCPRGTCLLTSTRQGFWHFILHIRKLKHLVEVNKLPWSN